MVSRRLDYARGVVQRARAVVGAASQVAPAALLLVAVGIPCAQLLAVGFPHAYDSRPHLVWSQHFASQLWAGELYPRWLAAVGDGFGAPVFFFYPPLAYYVSGALHPLLPAAESAPLRLALATALALVAAALALFAWLRRHLGPSPAALGAALYTLAPYHVMIDVWLRGAYAEVWAFAWPPCLLWAVDEAGARPPRALLALAVGAALLLLTHPPTALTALPLVGVYAVACAVRARSAAPALVGLLGLAFGAGLAGAYLATALTHGPFVDQQHMFRGHYDYRGSFLFAALPLLPHSWMQGGALAMAGASAAVALGLPRASSRGSVPPAAGWLARFAGACAAAYLFLMLPVSGPVWERLPLLQKIQFPWRLSLELVLLASASLAAAFAWGLGARPERAGRLWAGAGVGVLLLLGATLFVGPHKPIKPARAARYLAESRSQPEHRVPHAEDPTALLGPGQRVAFARGAGEARVEAWAPRRIALLVESDGAARLALRQQLYPGWQARAEGQPCCLPVDGLRAYGIVAIDLPPGRHRVRVTLGPTPYERAGWIASGVSAALLAATAGLWRRGARGAAC